MLHVGMSPYIGRHVPPVPYGLSESPQISRTVSGCSGVPILCPFSWVEVALKGRALGQCAVAQAWTQKGSCIKKYRDGWRYLKGFV